MKPKGENRMNEYIIYNDKNNFYSLDELVRHNQEPNVINGSIYIKKYKITIEEISEPLDILKERLKDLYKKETNWHNKESLDRYSIRLFGCLIYELDKEFIEEIK